MPYAGMQIGDLVSYEGRLYRLRGFDPAGVRPRLAYVEDPATGERREVPLDALLPAVPVASDRDR